MNRKSRLKLVLGAVVLPLLVAGCFSSNPTRQDGDDSGSSGGQPGAESPSSSPQSGSPESGSPSARPGSSGSTRGHRGTPDSPTSPPPQSSPTMTPTPGSTPGSTTGSTTGTSGDRDTSSDVRVATAGTPATEVATSDAAGDEMGDSHGDGQAEVSVAEALEGANAAVDAAADAVAEAEATISRAKEVPVDESGSDGGSSGEETFDPWAKAGAAENDESGEPASGQPQSGPQDATTASGENDDAANDSFDPFANYGDTADPASGQSKPGGSSLETADAALSTARAALNRARRSLIEAAQTGSGDADAEAVQLEAARAAMEAAAEAVIASAIAVLAASDAFADDGEYDAEAAQAAQETLADGIAMVVLVTQRDMHNASEALEATSELLSAAAALIGMLGRPDQQQDDTEYAGESGSERVASLEEQLDQSLAVFDDRMEVEGQSSRGAIDSDDSEITDLMTGDGAASGRVARAGANSKGGMSGYGVDADDQVVNSDIKPRYETPAALDRTELEDYAIEAGRDQDDDIVARQLREAAMAETDPELREALWREYKNYKESLETGEAEAN